MSRQEANPSAETHERMRCLPRSRTPGAQCQNILLDANTERATMFFRTHVSRGKDGAYVRGAGKRVSSESLKTIADRIKAIRDEHSVVSATGSGCDS